MLNLESKTKDYKAVQYELLDLLVDGQSSFAALYGGLVRHYNYSGKVYEIFSVLLEMRKDNCVKAWQMNDVGAFHEPTENDLDQALKAYQTWLPQAPFEDLAIDEVGLWYEITSKGLLIWKEKSELSSDLTAFS